MTNPRVLILDDDQHRLDIFYIMFRKEMPDLAVKGLKETWAVIRHLDKIKYKYVFLDHDLGREKYVDSSRSDCGMEVVRWMLKNKTPDDTVYIIHSMNHDAAREMTDKLRNAGFKAYKRNFLSIMNSSIESIIASTTGMED